MPTVAAAATAATAAATASASATTVGWLHHAPGAASGATPDRGWAVVAQLAGTGQYRQVRHLRIAFPLDEHGGVRSWDAPLCYRACVGRGRNTRRVTGTIPAGHVGFTLRWANAVGPLLRLSWSGHPVDYGMDLDTDPIPAAWAMHIAALGDVEERQLYRRLDNARWDAAETLAVMTVAAPAPPPPAPAPPVASAEAAAQMATYSARLQARRSSRRACAQKRRAEREATPAWWRLGCFVGATPTNEELRARLRDGRKLHGKRCPTYAALCRFVAAGGTREEWADMVDTGDYGARDRAFAKAGAPRVGVPTWQELWRGPARWRDGDRNGC